MTAASTDLTTLATLKSYLVNPGYMADLTLQRMISAASVAIENYVNRDIVSTDYTKTFDGSGGRSLVMPDYPLTAVSALTIDGQTIPAGTVATSGYFFTDKEIILNGYRFCSGKGNVTVSYTAGFAIMNEAQTIPASGTYSITPKQPKGSWTHDMSVTFANGTPLTAVTASPAAGQYVPPSVPPSTSPGQYVFSSADAGKGVLISYGYTPFDLEQACVALVQYWLSDRQHPGEASRSMGGQTITFSQKDMPDSVKTPISQYKRFF